MGFEKPNTSGFTIYSKSGCQNCVKVKNLIKVKNLPLNVIDCDEYIIEDKAGFLLFIKNLTQKEISFFPMIFYEGTFIGNYNETKDVIDKLFVSFDSSYF